MLVSMGLALSMVGLVAGMAGGPATTRMQPPHHVRAMVDQSAPSGGVLEAIPAHLFMPPDPPAPNPMAARDWKLPVRLAQRTTNYHHASPSQAKNIELVARRLNGVVVGPGETFSYFQHVGPYTQQNGYGWGRAFIGDRIVPSLGGGVCQGASTLYSAVLRTGLSVVERHRHGLTVPYLPPGEDATVSGSSQLDFRFRNQQPTPILITARAYPKQRYLTIALWGARSVPQITVRHRILAEYQYRTIRQVDAHLPSGSRVRFPGQVGAKVETWLDYRTPTGSHRREVGVDTYLASPRIVDIAAKP